METPIEDAELLALGMETPMEDDVVELKELEKVKRKAKGKEIQAMPSSLIDVANNVMLAQSEYKAAVEANATEARLIQGKTMSCLLKLHEMCCPMKHTSGSIKEIEDVLAQFTLKFLKTWNKLEQKTEQQVSGSQNTIEVVTHTSTDVGAAAPSANITPNVLLNLVTGVIAFFVLSPGPRSGHEYCSTLDNLYTFLSEFACVSGLLAANLFWFWDSPECMPNRLPIQTFLLSVLLVALVVLRMALRHLCSV